MNFLKYLGNTTPKTFSTSSSFVKVLPQVYNQKKLKHCASFETLRNNRENNVHHVERSSANTLYKSSSFSHENELTKENMENNSILNTKEQLLKQRPLRIKKKKTHGKDIKSLLEEFKNNNSITKKFEEIINSQQDSELFDANKSSKRGLQRLKPQEKREIFNISLYAKILPQKSSMSTRNLSLPQGNILKRNGSLGTNEINSCMNKDLFLSTNQIEVKNPLIKKHLESINYYGPRYSYCSSCKNRNIEFYNELQPNNCLNLIKIIKKMKNTE
jgi:hypothetical protein